MRIGGKKIKDKTGIPVGIGLSGEIDTDRKSSRGGGSMMTQGKIERWHQTLKNRISLENYLFPDDLETQIDAFVANYNICAITRASTI